jgi:hypothetical protein
MTAHWMWLGLVEFAWIAHSTGISDNRREGWLAIEIRA